MLPIITVHHQTDEDKKNGILRVDIDPQLDCTDEFHEKLREVVAEKMQQYQGRSIDQCLVDELKQNFDNAVIKAMEEFRREQKQIK